MELSSTVSVQDVKAVVVDSLDLHDRTEEIDAATPLGSLPELDSLAVVELVLELEDRFGIEVDGEDMTAEVFQTLGTLTAFIESKLS